MSDSRAFALRIMSRIQKAAHVQTKVIYFFLSIFISAGLTYILNEPALNIAQLYVLFLLFFAVGLWVTEAIPPFAVGLLVLGFLVFAMNNYYYKIDPENVSAYYQPYVNSWSNSVIWLMLGGFFIAEAMKKAELDQLVFKLAISKFGSSPKNILLGLMLTTALFSMIMSNTATTAMMVASVLPFLNKNKNNPLFSRAILIGIAASASIGGMGTIIGSPPNAVAVEALYHYGIRISFLEWMMIGVPSSVILVLIFWYFLAKRSIPGNINVQIELEEIKTTGIRHLQNKKGIVLFVLGFTLLLWLTEKLHNIPASVVALIPITFLTMFGIITGDDVRKLPWDTLMLVAGGLALGMAIKETGLAQFYVERIQEYELNFFILVLFFAFITMVLSNIMSNTATATILIPIGIILTYQNPVVLPLVIGLSASVALFLPISTPPNAIVYSTGRVEQKDFQFGGLLIGLIGPLIISALVVLVFMYLYKI